MTHTIELDIVSDIMCPWCYVGKRRLEKALASLPPEISVSITWRPFQLDATIPPKGRDRQEYLSAKFGTPDQIRETYQPIVDAGKKEGIAFDFEAIDLSPNTFDGHRVMHWARAEGLENEMAEQFFNGLFVEGKDLTQSSVLVELASKAGLDGAVVERLLAGDADRDTVQAELDKFRQMGVQSVPTLIVDNKYVVVGAQEPETIANVIVGVFQENIGADQA